MTVFWETCFIFLRLPWNCVWQAWLSCSFHNPVTIFFLSLDPLAQCGLCWRHPCGIYFLQASMWILQRLASIVPVTWGHLLSPSMGLRLYMHHLTYRESQTIWKYLCGKENMVPHVACCLKFSFHEDFLRVLGCNFFKYIKVVSSLCLYPYSCSETLLL